MSERTPVFLQYTQAELDDAYDQRKWAPNMNAVQERNAAASVQTRAIAKHRRDIAYGAGDTERLDIFLPERSPAPIHVHVHGGGWRGGSKDTHSFVAAPFVAAGTASVILEFSLIPAVRIPEMIEQTRAAIAWIASNAASFGGDPSRIHLTGHSSGAHMAAVLATTDWSAYGLPDDVLASATLASGMYDLRPVMLSARRTYVTLDDHEIVALSPILHLDRLRIPLTVAVGSDESPEFRRQARDFASAVAAAGGSAHFVEVDGANHFEMLERLAEPGGAFNRAALDRMGL